LTFDSSNLRLLVAEVAAGGLMSGSSRLTEQEYLELLKPLAKELAAMARWVAETSQRVVIVFEGRDTAGKGGSIDMFARLLNPRQCRVVALPSPSERERSQWYFQRYVEHMPAAGEIVLFDRSWYNRAGVERVMGFATPDQVQDFLNATPQFERHLADDGILLFKYWLCCDQEVQEERFLNRLNNPTKRWKLSSIDLKARDHYDDYTEARELMLAATDTDYAPWTLVDFNDQPLGRLTLLRNVLDRIPDTELPIADIPWPPLKEQLRKERFGVLQPIAPYSPPVAKGRARAS
jgi:polyphosphate kinase 2